MVARQLRLALGGGPCELRFVIDEGLRELCLQRAEHLAMGALLFLQRELLLLGKGSRLVGNQGVVGGAERLPLGDRLGELRLHAAQELELAAFLFLERLALLREEPGLIGHQRLAGRSNRRLAPTPPSPAAPADRRPARDGRAPVRAAPVAAARKASAPDPRSAFHWRRATSAAPRPTARAARPDPPRARGNCVPVRAAPPAALRQGVPAPPPARRRRRAAPPRARRPLPRARSAASPDSASARASCAWSSATVSRWIRSCSISACCCCSESVRVWSAASASFAARSACCAAVACASSACSRFTRSRCFRSCSSSASCCCSASACSGARSLR